MKSIIDSLLVVIVYFIFAIGIASFATIGIASIDDWWKGRTRGM